MAELSFDEILEASLRLAPEQKLKLADALRVDSPRDLLLSELARRKAYGAFERAESLFGKYARPQQPDVSEDELNTYLHSIRTEWEEELNVFFGEGD
ncbi:MAG: hypothetical protein AAFU54_31035 [Chloroflexota bacterium]